MAIKTKTMDFKEFVSELDKELVTVNPRQKTIDLVENAYDMAHNETPTIEGLGAFAYEITICLEIINPKLEDDRRLLNKLLSVIRSEKQRLVEFENKQPYEKHLKE